MVDLEIEVPLKSFLACVEELESTVSGLRDNDLDRNAGEGWTIRQIVHHIADGDDIWKNCIQMVLGNPGSEFHLSWYWSIPQDVWTVHWRYQQRDIQLSLMRFRVNREYIVDLLSRRPEAWQAYACVHWPGDMQETRITIADVIEMQTNHVHNHCADIREICQLGISTGVKPEPL
jgi:DinB superfamily